MRHERIDTETLASGPHEAMVRRLEQLGAARAHALIVFATATQALGAIRIEAGRASHVAYAGALGERALKSACDDGVMRSATHTWQQHPGTLAPCPWDAGGERARVDPGAPGRTLRREAPAQALEAWAIGGTRNAGPSPRAPGGGTPTRPEVDGATLGGALERTRQGLRWKGTDSAGNALVWLTPAPGDDSANWTGAMQRRHSIVEAHLVPARGPAPGATGAGFGPVLGTPADDAIGTWTGAEAAAAVIGAGITLSQLHLKGLVHGDTDGPDIGAPTTGWIELGGGALALGENRAGAPTRLASDTLEEAVLGRTSVAADFRGLACTVLGALAGHRPKPIVDALFDDAEQDALVEAVRRLAERAGAPLARFVAACLDPYPKSAAGAVALVRAFRRMAETEYGTSALGAVARAPARTLAVAPPQPRTHGPGAATATAPPAAAPSAPAPPQTTPAPLPPPPHAPITQSAPSAPALTEAMIKFAGQALAMRIGDTDAAKRVAKANERAERERKPEKRLDAFVKALCETLPSSEREALADTLQIEAVRLEADNDDTGETQ